MDLLFNKKMSINPEWVAKSIGYHGQPLQKIWEGEMGEHNLYTLGITSPDYSAYQTRQKYFSFQDRAKRLKFHLFVAKKAKELFEKQAPLESKVKKVNGYDPTNSTNKTDLYAELPPFNVFLSERANKIEQVKYLYSHLKVGDIVYGTIVSNRAASGFILRILCSAPPNVCIFHDLNAKAFLPQSVVIPAVDRKGTTRTYLTNDLVCCEIIELNDASDRMVVGMKGALYQLQQNFNDEKTELPPFGLITSDQLPETYKLSLITAGQCYDTILESSTGFRNPKCIDHLSKAIGLDPLEYYTNMSSLRGKYPKEEYAGELRQTQASSWAFRSVADGIEHFKEGRHSEAFQCLNKALNIDPRNVEGLVARGALYANNGSFKKAVEDFETALKLNPSHANARKYMGETLVALGRSYEEENNVEEAKKAYQDCLTIIPHHEEALNSLNFLWNKSGSTSKQVIELGDLALPTFNPKINEQNRTESTLPGQSSSDVKKESKKSKKKKSKSRKRHSSSSSSSDSSDSSDSSSNDSSSSSESSSSSDSELSKSKRKKKRLEKTRQKSLSPLSKRMALIGGADIIAADTTSIGYNYPQSFASSGVTGLEAVPNEYDLRVNKFLDMTRDDDNYEEKVRKFVEEASKYTKERKNQEDKSKKKDRKKSKKNKKDTKKKKKEKKSKSSKKDKDDVIDGMELREALKIFTKLPIFDVGSKKIGTDIESVEKSLNQLKEEREKKLAELDRSKPQEDTKWKMMFSKDGKKEVQKPIPKQYAFANEDDDQDSDPPAERVLSKSYEEKVHSFQRTSSYGSRSKYDDVKLPSNPPIAPLPSSSGPPVLDKFGNFRRAPTTEITSLSGNMVPDKLPEPSSYRRGDRSRSRSRSSDSRRSRSRSRSNRHSRSRSYGRRGSRSLSRHKSRSYSRSRSRSDSLDRRDRRRWGGTYYRPRFNNNRGRFMRGGFRDFRNNRGRERWGNRGNRWGNNRGGNRFRNYRDDSRERRFDRRSRSGSARSFDSLDRKRSVENDDDRNSKQTKRRSSAQPPSPPGVGNTLPKTESTAVGGENSNAQ